MLDGAFYPEGFRAELNRCWRIGCGGDPDIALLHALGVREAAAEAGDAVSMTFASQQMAWFCFQLGEVEQGLGHAQTALRLSRQRCNAAGEAWASAMHAWLLLEAGLIDEAADDALAALALAEAAGEPHTLAFAVNVTGVVFWYCKQLDRALEFCSRAVAIARGLDQPCVLAWWLINLAGVHSELANRARRNKDHAARREATAAAVSVNQEAIDIAAAVGDFWCLRLGLCNGAEYLIDDDAPAALALIGRSEHLPGRAGPRSLVHYYYTKAQMLIRLGRFAEALPVCTEALARAEAVRSTDSIAYAHRYLSEAHEGLGNFREALACFKRFHDANAVLAAETTQMHARVAEIRYETSKFRALADAEQKRADQLVRTTLLDPLTGIANRRRFDECLSRLEAQGTPYAIAMIDLDHFKGVNDRFSHLVGDDVLRCVGAILTELCRPQDLAVRMGGEEFALLIDGGDLADARRQCQAVRQRLADVIWTELHEGLQRVTASIGVATSDEAAGPKALLALADARLYHAKLSGRDRVVTWIPTEATTLAM